jgi:hypothetical protein
MVERTWDPEKNQRNLRDHKRLPNHVRSTTKPTLKRLTTMLDRLGAHKVDRLRLGKPRVPGGTDRAPLWIIRRQEMYQGLDNIRLAEMFWRQRGAPDLFECLDAAD